MKKNKLIVLFLLSIFLVVGCTKNEKSQIEENTNINEEINNDIKIPDDASDYSVTIFMNGNRNLVLPQMIYLMIN